jgi:FkbM family methyltransferase
MLRIRTFIDVGANAGQWYLTIHEAHKDANFWCFEPLPEMYTALAKLASVNGKLRTANLAMSNFTGKAKLNISSNKGASSSLQKPSNHLSLHKNIHFENTREVQVETLDVYFKDIELESRVYLKMDVQGHEWKVIEGARELLQHIDVIELESSMSPQYEGEIPHHQLINKIMKLGFVFFCGSKPRTDEQGRQWDLNSILIRENLVEHINVKLNENSHWTV